MGKQEILENIRKGKPEAKAHPGVFQAEILNDREQLTIDFAAQAGLVGAEVTDLDNSKNMEQFLSDKFQNAIDFRKVENCKKYSANCQKNELAKLKVVILEGKFGVAENGAVWVDDSCFSNRLIPFITEHLIILLPKKNLLSTMDEAYEIISKKDYGFSVFVSGPSKTADIEQSLVYGAHGAKKMLILLTK